MDLTGTVALVTGASGGIGAGVARRFARAGAAVVGHAFRGEVEGAGLVVRGDLTDEGECSRVVREAAAWRGRLDAVVNCAGVQPVRDLAELTAADWREVVDANVLAAFSCTRAAAEVMRSTGGSVTHIASIEGSRPAHGHAHYSASKAALIMFARSAALEYGRHGIRVNTVSPGLVDRPGLAEAWPEGVARWRAAAPLGRLGTPDDVGDACVFLASPVASWITGHDLVVDGGVGAHPTW
ncbi:SDR family NAD(P)-dependent oxidoreductase [Saccharothrix australiensis]|uniref:3-oxoacyl-[acyl-carrier protein] reductase n=1 Tax=Saccharothrix australiensis TaxID=2072 RepID=A0A495W414_9PSEU|nr:SDR family oxidoreductase [Saccharothrix australiensis]RKT56239.1 3-oxoacyl-[acyl-carrier protein] reductase [Saccharothrix australiensis]